MKHTYTVTGMTCSGCQAKVQDKLSRVKGVEAVSIDLNKSEAEISMSQHVPLSDLKNSLKDYPKYQINEKEVLKPVVDLFLSEEENRTWLETYKPILVVFGYIVGITLLVELRDGIMNWMSWMNYFMASFFLVFSFFKILNLQGFSESYSMYDIIAKRWSGYGSLYAFIELGLGIAYLTGFNPILTNIITFIVMFISIIGVLQSVLNRKKIKCACLGAVFNLPMSTVTIIEDALMIGMSLVMLIIML